MRQALLQQLDQLDQWFSRLYLRVQQQRPSLMIWVFHALFQDEKAIQEKNLFPFEQLTVGQLATFLSHFQQKGHAFVTPRQLAEGLPQEGFYQMLTFDDGYYNNQWALPILEAYQVPALFHIATSYIERHRSFWWDVHFRENVRLGLSMKAILHAQNQLKKLTFEEVEAVLTKQFGAAAFEPRGDQDRPFRPEELKAFAQHPLVHLGNHSHDHAILPHYSEAEIRHQVCQSQQYLAGLTGQRPTAIAYPNGEVSPQVVEIARTEGLELGLTGERKKYFFRDPMPLMRLGRVTLYGFRQIAGQAETYRSDRSMKWRGQ